MSENIILTVSKMARLYETNKFFATLDNLGTQGKYISIRGDWSGWGYSKVSRDRWSYQGRPGKINYIATKWKLKSSWNAQLETAPDTGTCNLFDSEEDEEELEEEYAEEGEGSTEGIQMTGV